MLGPGGTLKPAGIVAAIRPQQHLASGRGNATPFQAAAAAAAASPSPRRLGTPTSGDVTGRRQQLGSRERDTRSNVMLG